MPKVVLTFDDNKWNHYSTVFPLLKKYDLKATFAYITSGTFTNEDKNDKAIQEMLDYGIEICSHSHSHFRFDFSLTSEKDLFDDLVKNRKQLEKHGINDFGLIVPYNWLKVPKSFLEFFNYKYVVNATSTIDNYRPNPKRPILKFTKKSNLNKFNVRRIEFPLDDRPQSDVDKFYKILESLRGDEIFAVMFHNVSDHCKSINVRPDTFEYFLHHLSKMKYDVTTLKDIYNFS